MQKDKIQLKENYSDNFNFIFLTEKLLPNLTYFCYPYTPFALAKIKIFKSQLQLKLVVRTPVFNLTMFHNIVKLKVFRERL